MPSVTSCSTIITIPASLWSVERREPEKAIRLRRVARVQRPHREDENVREDLARGEEREREREPSGDA